VYLLSLTLLNYYSYVIGPEAGIGFLTDRGEVVVGPEAGIGFLTGRGEVLVGPEAGIADLLRLLLCL
jgi:hypothetical protein